MDVFSCIATRHSTRKFKEEPVPQELLDKVIEAGRQAPSGKHKNQDHFLVIRKQETMQELAALVRQEFAKMKVTPENDDNFGGAIRASKKGSYNFLYNPAAFIIVANKKDYGNNFCGRVVRHAEHDARGQRRGPRLVLDQPAARDLRRTRGSCAADRVRRTGGSHCCLLRSHRLHREGNAGKAAS